MPRRKGSGGARLCGNAAVGAAPVHDGRRGQPGQPGRRSRRHALRHRRDTNDPRRDRNEILPAFLGYYERYEGYGFWAAIEKLTGQFLGWFHFRPREGASPDEVELGYRLRKSAWGKGYATEGSRALIRKGFTEFGVRRVVAEAMAVNLASRRVMEKAGLTLVRTFHQPWPYPIEGDELGMWSTR